VVNTAECTKLYCDFLTFLYKGGLKVGLLDFVQHTFDHFSS